MGVFEDQRFSAGTAGVAAAMAAFTANDTITKAVSSEMNFGQMMLVRGVVAIVLILACNALL